MMLSYLLLSLIFPFACHATTLIISIPPSVILPNPSALSAATHATLLSGSQLIPVLTTPLTIRSTLEFHNLSLPDSALGPQSFLLTISAPSHVLAPYRVDLIPGGVSSSSGGSGSKAGAAIEGVWETYLGAAWGVKGPILGGKAAQGGGASGKVNPGETEQEQVVQIDAKVLAQREFYEERAGFKPLSLLMNPMVLLGVVALGITFGMPHLMDNLDPELRAEFEEQSKKSPLSGMHKALQDATGGSGGGSSAEANPSNTADAVRNFDLASWMAGAKQNRESTTTSSDVREGGTRRRG